MRILEVLKEALKNADGTYSSRRFAGSIVTFFGIVGYFALNIYLIMQMIKNNNSVNLAIADRISDMCFDLVCLGLTSLGFTGLDVFKSIFKKGE